MNKRELIEALKDVPDDALIYQSSDAEGNGYCETRAVNADGRLLHDDVYFLSWGASGCCMDQSQFEKMAKTKQVVVLFP